MTGLSQWMISYRFKRILYCQWRFSSLFERYSAGYDVWWSHLLLADCSPQPWKFTAAEAGCKVSSAVSVVCPPEITSFIVEEPSPLRYPAVHSRDVEWWRDRGHVSYWTCKWVTLKNVLPSRGKTCALVDSWSTCSSHLITCSELLLKNTSSYMI